MLGAQLLRGQWLQAVRGRGGAAPGGREKRLQPCRPQRPEMARGWVGEQVGPGKLKGRRLSCGLRIRARSQCGCSLSAPARRRTEGAGSLVSGEQDGPSLGFGERGPASTPASAEKASAPTLGSAGEDGPSPNPSLPRSGEVKAPEQPDSLRSLLPAGRASAYARPPPWGRRGPAPRAPPGALHPLLFPGSAAAGARAPGASAAPRPAPARAGPRRRSACSASESCCCSRRSLAPLAPPPPPLPLPSQDNSQYGGARLPPPLLPAGQRVRGVRAAALAPEAACAILNKVTTLSPREKGPGGQAPTRSRDPRREKVSTVVSALQDPERFRTAC